MDFERALETQRLRLLRLVAGLVVLVGVLSLGPVSKGFSGWTCRFVGSILSRAETAARYLAIAQVRMMLARSGMELNQRQISDSLARAYAPDDVDLSLLECRRRLRGLCAVLEDLPRFALRLLRWIEKQTRRASGTLRVSPFPDGRLVPSLSDWQLAGARIERPPDPPPPTAMLL